MHPATTATRYEVTDAAGSPDTSYFVVRTSYFPDSQTPRLKPGVGLSYTLSDRYGD